MKNLKLKIGLGLVIWLAIISYMIVPQQIQVSFPESYPRIILKTRPVDPRDFLRGDYVILNYEIASPSEILETTLGVDYKNLLEKSKFDDELYFSFELDKERRAKLILVSKDKPASGIFLKGKVKKNRWGGGTVVFGIEKYFVPEGKGRILERLRNKNKLEVEIAVHPEKGKGLITDILVEGKRVEDLDDLDVDNSFGIIENTNKYINFSSAPIPFSLVDSQYDFLQDINRSNYNNDYTSDVLRVKYNQGVLEVWDKELLEVIDLSVYFKSLFDKYEEKDRNNILPVDFVYEGTTEYIRFKIFFESMGGRYQEQKKGVPSDFQVSSMSGVILFSGK